MLSDLQRQRRLQRYLALTACISGAVVMVVEIAGARLIAPYFGVGLYVWTALISITLLSLAAGYAVGGALADRRPDAGVLFLLIGLAGAWLSALPWLRAVILEWCIPLGLRAGTLTSATLLFAPALCLLGAVSPYVVRLYAGAAEALGRTVGRLYAVSTAGSFAGAIVAGFYLLPVIGVGWAIALSGLALIALCAGFFLLVAGSPARSAASASLALAALFHPSAPSEARLADGTVATLVDHRHSHYGDIKVIDYRFGERIVRELTIDGLVQGGIERSNGLPVYEYLALLEQLPRQLRPDMKRALVVGLGAGVLPVRYAAQGLAVAAVDIDPAVRDMALRHFGLPPTIPVHLEDARAFLARPGERYDLIVLDVFNGDITPGHLLSIEAVRTLKSRLAPGGLAAFNVIGSLDPEISGLPATLRTVRELFPELVLYRFFSETDGGNAVIFASDTPFPTPSFAALRGAISPLAADGVARAMASPLVLDDRFDKLRPLTDDHNPVDVMDQPVRDSIRRGILASTPLTLLGTR